MESFPAAATARRLPLFACLLLATAVSSSAAERPVTVSEAVAGLRKAAGFYRQQVARQGGYVYYYTPDLSERWGEGPATENQIWVQPPGTPTVGLAYLEAYRATGDSFYRDAAREAAEALCFGQLQSGGWTNAIDVSRRAEGAAYEGGKRRREGFSSLDDGQTQSAIRLLVRADRALGFQHVAIHAGAALALDALLAAQFPNGGFPQGWRGPVEKHPVVAARYPAHDWRTEGRIKNYWDMVTLNDNVCGYVAETLLDAHRVYHDPRYQDALRRLGDFLILAQMPDPQPAWAQQYNVRMEPIWARKFEPAAIASDETQEAIQTLMTIFRETRDPRYLQPIPRALQWLAASQLPDGQLARYYELHSNRPLYMHRRGDTYSLTYDDSRLPAHYGWKIDSRIDQLRAEYERLVRGVPADSRLEDPARPLRAILDALDDQGRWISTYQGEPLVGQPKFPVGTRFLSSDVFSRNVTALSRFIAAASRPDP